MTTPQAEAGLGIPPIDVSSLDRQRLLPQSDDPITHPSTAAFAGHPIHPALVPLPIGFLTAAALADLGYLLRRDRFWTRAARWLLGAGVAAGGIAAVPGLIDFTSIKRARQPIGIAHAVGNATILALAATSLRIRLARRDNPGAAALFLSGAAAVGLTVTGWLGGELAFRHRIGVARSLPQRTEDRPRSVPL